MEAWFAWHIAKQFLDGFHRCLSDHELPQTGKRQALVPAIVCAAFSIEVGLKAILIGEGKPIQRRHHLVDLFNDLSHVSQESIVSKTALARSEFDAELKLVSGAFQEWRYVYEEAKGRSVNQQFLLVLATATLAVATKFNQA